MWPKIFAQLLPQLIDVLPHVKRVVPMADKYLAARAAEDAALGRTMEGIRSDTEGIRAEVGKNAATHAALSRQIDGLTTQLNNHAAQLTTVSKATDDTRSVTTALGHSIIAMERQIRSLRALLVSLLVLVVVLVLMCAWLILLHRR